MTTQNLPALEITELKFFPAKKRPAEGGSNVRAFCTVIFNQALIVSGVRIREGKKGIYITFPLNTAPDGRRWPLVYPASGEARRNISAHILANYALNHRPEAAAA